MTQNRPQICILLVGSVTGDKVEPAIYAAKIENCGDCWVTVYLDRQRGAFHGTSPELGSAMFGDPRSTVASPSHDGER